MTYYEELGVSHDASIEDIRQAYKLMARLLHPDRQLDPDLKQIADRQMKRLSEIVGVLIDPRTRSHYDDILLLGDHLQAPGGMSAMPVPPSAGPWHGGNRMGRFAVRYWFWILTGVFVIGLSTWSFLQPNLTLPVRELQGEQRDTVAEPQPAQHRANPRINPGTGHLSPIRPETQIPAAEETWAPVPALPERLDAPLLEDVPPVLLAAPEPLSELGQSLPPQSLPPLPGESSFAGRWLYAPKADDVAERGVYPPRYAELQLVERGGEMTGDYHALYKVHDRAVSPEVAFQIRGAAESATSAKFDWVARDRAKGRAEMTLQGPNVLYVTWWTTAFGRQDTLGSGTAVLIRQQVP